jgi:hypothetical protein
MASVEFIHFCGHAFFDSHGAPCLIGVVGELFARRFPMSIERLTVAVALRLSAGEKTSVTVEIGPPDEPAKRAARFRVEGPPTDGSLASGLQFLPFATLSVYIDRPQIIEARVRENDALLGAKALPIVSERQQTANQDEGIHLP